jgi:hypothetical protein
MLKVMTSVAKMSAKRNEEKKRPRSGEKRLKRIASYQ